MPRGYRCILVAFVGWLTLAASQPPADAKREALIAQNQITETLANATAAKKAIEDAKYQEPCEQGEDRRYSDLCAQWKAADAANNASRWAWWQMFISMFGIVGLAVTLLLTARSTKAAIEAVETQIATERPVMHMSKLKLTPGKPSKAWPLKLNVLWDITNHGKTGCWVDQVNVTLRAGNAPSQAHLNGMFDLCSFVAAGKGLSSVTTNRTLYF